MYALPLTFSTYSYIATRHTTAGDLPRQYLLDYIVWQYGKYIEVLPAGAACYAVALRSAAPRSMSFIHADFAAIPGVRVLARSHRVATLFLPFANSEQVIREEVACCFASYEAKSYDITSELPRYEKEVHEETQAEYHLDKAA